MEVVEEGKEDPKKLDKIKEELIRLGYDKVTKRETRNNKFLPVSDIMTNKTVYVRLRKIKK